MLSDFNARRRNRTKDAPQTPRSPYLSSRFSLPPSLRSNAPSDVSIQDVLAPGDVVGDGFFLQGEQIRTVAAAAQPHEPAQEFEVIKQLGTGSYAVVYLVHEVLSRPPPSEDGHMSTIGAMEFDHPKQVVQYGRKYAIKCLSKADLDEEALAVQMSEVTIHQSLPLHPNIVSLHRTLETSSFLLLLLEYVPGEDLFYFLEQARDHYDLDSDHTDSSVASHTPPTPSLLSNLNPSQLLSRTRLRLISSMFSQMCDAVAVCHAAGVYHRDIKPENFIVTDGLITSPDGRAERKVIVKLTDFGLSTTDLESADMDCGSAPYMSYECRNNVAPTYRPRGADVWSLGIVLINMLYHFNPWTDTADGVCGSFDIFRKDPVAFFMQRFMGMTRPVADVLANRVFCILENPHDDAARMTAAEFGAWARTLPSLLGAHAVHRSVSAGSTQGHRISLTMPLSHRPQSRHPSGSTTAGRTPAIAPRILSRAPSFDRAELSTVIDNDNEDDAEAEDEGDVEVEGMTSRSTSTNKRRKRGTRRNKSAATAHTTLSAFDSTLRTLADASQSLAREISMTSKSSSRRSGSISVAASHRSVPHEPVSMYPVPAALLYRPPPLPVTASAAAPTPAPVTKKPSKWKLSFGKASAPAAAQGMDEAALQAQAQQQQDAREREYITTHPHAQSLAMASTANNVATLLMGLNAPPQQPQQHTPSAPIPFTTHHGARGSSSSISLPRNDADAASTWSRGRRGVRDPSPLGVGSHYAAPMQQPHARRQASRSPGHALAAANNPHARSVHSLNHPLPPHPMHGVPAPEPWAAGHANGHGYPGSPAPNGRQASPPRVRAVAPLPASSASSVVSSNWRSSMSTASSAGTSTSAFTRYSNSSARSVSTTATSVSSASWRTSVTKPSSAISGGSAYAGGVGLGGVGGPGAGVGAANGYPQGHLPKNIKIMDGVPWELDQLPRGQHPNPVGDIFGAPPVRKVRTRKPPKDLTLDTITERPPQSKHEEPGSINYNGTNYSGSNTYSSNGAELAYNGARGSVGGGRSSMDTGKNAAYIHGHNVHSNTHGPPIQQQTRARPVLAPTPANAMAQPVLVPRAPKVKPRPAVQPHLRRDASTSTTDLSGLGGEEDGGKKVQKAQINTLAKLLSAMTGNGRK